VDAVDGGFEIGGGEGKEGGGGSGGNGWQGDGWDKVDVGVAVGFYFFKDKKEGGVFVIDGAAEGGVVTGVGVDGVFDEEDGGVGVGGAEDAAEGFEAFEDLVAGDVGHEVEEEEGGVGVGHEGGDVVIEEGVAAESEVYYFALEGAGEDVGVGHARAGGAAALEDAGAVGDNGTGAAGEVDGGREEGGGGVEADVEGAEAVVEGEVDHPFAGGGLHAGDEGGFGEAGGGAGGSDVGPCLVFKAIEVEAFDAGGGHVGEDGVAEGFPTDVDPAGVGAEAEGEAGGAFT
jgi:hypothetical protein